MKIKDVVSELKNGKTNRYYMIAGTEGFLRDLALKSIIPLLEIQMEEWNVSTIREGTELTAALDALPLMSERRAVLCNSGDIEEDVAVRISAYLPQMPQSTVFILIKDSSPDKKKKLERFFVENGILIECSAPSDSESTDFLCGYAAKNGVKFSRRYANEFCRYVSGDLSHLVSELEKLLAVSDGEITQKDIEKYTVHSADYNIFKLHDFMLEQRWPDARELLNEILDEDPMPIGLISILSSNFELMLIARACLDAGYNEETKKSIVESAKVAEFRARKAVSQSRFMDAQKIRRVLRELSKLDFDAKQGNVILKNDLYAILTNLYTGK
jgi:DNA polymerase-3 subunit delta